jgi:hypothetical protein
MAGRTPRDGGTGGNLDPQRGHEKSFGTRPSVGQGGKAYVSGSNAHQKHQSPTRGPAPGQRSGLSRVGGPRDGFDGK